MKKEKPQMDLKRPLSWSAISSFKYDPEQWYRKYVLKQEDPASLEMLFGNVVGERLAKDKDFLPEVPRYKKFEKKFNADIAGIPIVGFLDSYCPDTHAFHEYKTSSNASRWTHKSVQEHGQIMMYKLLIWINKGVTPEKIKCHLTYIPVMKVGGFRTGFKMALSEKKPQVFEAKHSSKQVLEFANIIKDTYAKMQEYAEKHR